MGFTEEVFLFIFMPISIIGYLLISRLRISRVDNAYLVGISLLFYGWASLDTLAIFVLLCVGIYLLGNLMHASIESEEPCKRKRWLGLSVGLFILLLAYYKYATFMLDVINKIAGTSLSVGKLIVPIGLSFAVFESISYIVDIYRGDALPGSLMDAFLYMSLFPKLVSGPLVLWRDFSKQISDRAISADDVMRGIDRIIIGYAKKVIIADAFGAQIRSIEQSMAASGIDNRTAWLRCILYFFELYYDFSGYSDIAIGLCAIFGFSIDENFDFPYCSLSITEFWRRWHISLGKWFREYVYIPLGGNRRGNVYLHLFAVFVLTGIWHGANWTFLVWGTVHGLVIVLERFCSKRAWYTHIPAPVKWFCTMIILFFSWVLFMSPDLPTAVHTYRELLRKRKVIGRAIKTAGASHHRMPTLRLLSSCLQCYISKPY